MESRCETGSSTMATLQVSVEWSLQIEGAHFERGVCELRDNPVHRHTFDSPFTYPHPPVGAGKSRTIW